jgi:uncharacterized protein YuzE
VSSGDQVRHRLSRAGNRRNGHALHMMAVTQLRYPGSAGRQYYERKRTEGKTPKGGAALPQAAAVRPGLLPDARRSAAHNRRVRITYDPDADAVYIHLTGVPLTPGRTTVQAQMPPGTDGFIALDWKDSRLVGIEILTRYSCAPRRTRTFGLLLRRQSLYPLSYRGRAGRTDRAGCA